MSVLIVGSIGLDTIKTPFGKVKDALGGSVIYSSVSASYFSNVKLVGVVGTDFSNKHMDILKRHKIDLKGMEVAQGETFKWEGEYNWDFSNPKTIATHLNVFASFDPKLPQEYKNTPYVFLANIDPIIQAKVLDQVKKPKVVLCDTMNYWIQSKKAELIKLLKRIDIFLVNEGEARQLSGEMNLIKASRVIRKMGCKTLIIKKGEHGALLFNGNSVFCAPAYLMESISDPTGAGDTFAGGFIGYLAKKGKVTEENLRKAVVYGSIMATFTVEDFSLNRLANIKKQDIEKRYKEFCCLTGF
jgi:hypothetical protein